MRLIKSNNIYLKHEQSINIQVTHNCNFSCDYCSNSKHAVNGLFLDIQKIRIFLDNFRKYADNTEILLIGGEPTLHPDIISIIKLCESYDYIVKVSLITNGSNLNKILQEQYTNKFNISISYHPSSNISFERYMEIFKKIKLTDINLNIKYVVDNSEDIETLKSKYNQILPYTDFGTLHPIYHMDYSTEVYRLIDQNFIDRGRVNTLYYDTGYEEVKSEFYISEVKNLFTGMKCEVFEKCYIVSPIGFLYTSCDNNLKTAYRCFIPSDLDKFMNSNKNKICTLEYCNCKVKYKKYI